MAKKKAVEVESPQKERYSITVMGKPVPKERPRLFKGRVITPKKTLDYEAKVAKATIEVIKEPMTERGISITIVAYFRTKVHGDADNIAKSILDGMNKVAFTDDRLINELHVYILYVETDAEMRADIEIIG